VAVILGPDGGPPIPIKIEPQDFHNAAQQFVQASTTLYQVLPTLFRVLDGFRGPAGVDDSAKQLDAAYRPAVQSIITGVNRAVNLLGDIGVGIDTSARNHWNADAAAAPSDGAPPPWSPVDTGLVLPQSLSVPSLVGSPTAVLPPPLSESVPMGHIDDLHTVAQAFRTARDTIQDASTTLHNTLEFLFSHNQSADLDALNQFWNHVGGNADTAILTALQRACDQIASAVDDYANWTIDTQNQILDAIGEFLKNAALGAVAALLLRLITDGLGALAAILKAADDVGEGGVLVATISGAIALADTRLVAIGGAAGGVVGAMTTAINATPNPNIDPTEPQSVNDDQVVHEAETVGDEAGGVKPPQAKYPAKQVQSHFKHAGDFGVDGSYSKANAQAYEEALRNFADDPQNVVNSSGQYHGEPAVLIYNPTSSLCEVLRPDGTYWTGWRLGTEQLRNVMERGSLGGG
jgi:hypothetical protein